MLHDDEGAITTLTRAKAFCLAGGLPFEGIDFEVQPEPLEHALHILNGIYDSVRVALEGYGKVHTLLSDRVTFRHKLATIRPYKGNRENSRKPYWGDAIRAHMYKYRDAAYVEDLEADDLCGIFQRDDTVIVGVDKDLLTIPGAHYNWKKKEFMLINELEADRNFYTQLLEGDKVDNIPGLAYCTDETVKEYSLHFSARKGCGPAASRSILESAETSEEMYRRVKECYTNTYFDMVSRGGDEPDGRHELGALMDIQEVGRLLFMTRELREDCTPVLWELPDEDDRRAVEGL